MGKRGYGQGSPYIRQPSITPPKAVVVVLSQSGAPTFEGTWASILNLQGFHSSFRKGSSENRTRMEQKCTTVKKKKVIPTRHFLIQVCFPSQSIERESLIPSVVCECLVSEYEGNYNLILSLFVFVLPKYSVPEGSVGYSDNISST